MKDRILKMMQKEDVCIIMDFDYTITDYSSYSSIGVFKNYLGKKYCIRKEKIDNAISQLEKNNDELLEMLWRKKIDLLHEFVNEDFLNKINVSDNFIIRNEIKIILKKANELNIPVYIISSGCGEVIEKVLSDNRLDYNNIQIIANYILKQNNVITPKNKKSFLNIKYSNYIVFGDNIDDFFIKENNYNVKYYKDCKFRKLSEFQNKKCTFGIGLYKGEKIFYKTIFNGLKNELEGYKLVSKYYRVPKIINYSHDMIIYEYLKNFTDKTLYDYLYINNKLVINYKKIFNSYKRSLKNIISLNENDLKNNLFYKKRLYQIDVYINDNSYKKYLPILLDIKKHIESEKKLYSFVSQGDPTDTNITVDGEFCDFENGGYNSLVGEIAIFIVSILFFGGCIYPKYNSNAYKIRDKWKISKPNEKNIELLLKYLKMFRENLDENVIQELDRYLKYYICFRLLTPINVSIMSKSDQKIIIKNLLDFYNLKNFDEIIDKIGG